MVDPKKIKVEVSNRHAHLNKEHINILFGKDYQLNVHKPLSQPGHFASSEKITILNNDKKIENVRILGPPRDETQIEISRTDAFLLKLNPPIKLSGDLENSEGITLLGPKGQVTINKGVIISHRHLHVSHEQAEKLNLKHGQYIKAKIPGIKETIFSNIIVRVDSNYDLALHLDRDEGNACCIEEDVFAELIFD